LVQSGAHVELWDRNPDVLKRAADSLGAAASTHVVDGTDASALAKPAAEGDAKHGIHMLVNSAGIAGKNAPLDEYEIAEWLRVIDIDLNGTLCVKRDGVAVI